MNAIAMGLGTTALGLSTEALKTAASLGSGIKNVELTSDHTGIEFTTLNGEKFVISIEGLNTLTDEDLQKLKSIEDNAQVNVNADWNDADENSKAYIKNKPTYISDFTNDLDFVTKSVNDLLNYYTKTQMDSMLSDLPSGGSGNGGGGNVTYTDISNLLPTSENQGTEILLKWTNPSSESYIETELYWSASDLTHLTKKQCTSIGTLIVTKEDSYLFTDLKVGTTRYFKFFVKYNSFGTDAYSDGIATSVTTIDITPPNPITNFFAKGGNECIYLSWENPTDSDFAGTRIVRNTDAYPESITDGVTIYNNTGTSYIDTDIITDKKYYYRAFPYDLYNNYNTTQEGQEAICVPLVFRVMTVKIDLTNSNPSTCITYADDAIGMEAMSSDWDTFFGHKPCLFKDGKVVGYLNPNDFTKFEDGTSADITSGNEGDVMIEFPRRGLIINTVENILTVSMTDDPHNNNFEYLAHTRGLEDRDYFYLGAYKGYVSDERLHSLSDKVPTGAKTIANFRTTALAVSAYFIVKSWLEIISSFSYANRELNYIPM